MLIIALIPLLLLFIPVVTTEKVTKTVTHLVSASDELYKRFIRTVYSKNLNKFDFHDDIHGVYYTLRPDQPLEFEKYTYYWNESHEDLVDKYEICEYQIDYGADANELSHTYFPDGTRLRSMYFHCSFPFSCHGMGCSIEARFILGILFIIIIFLTLYFIRKRVIEEIDQMEKVRDQFTRPQYSPGPRYMAPLTLTADCPEPPPPSYNTMFSASPPSYESVIRDKVTYTLPSYTAVA